MLNYSLKRTSEPSVEAVSLSELKAHLRIDHADDDVALASLIKACRQWVERDIGRALITQTWRLKLDSWPKTAIVLHHSPVQSVTSITYVDAAGATQTLAATEYVVDTDSQPGLICLAYGKSWPSLRGQPRDVTVTFVAGYGAAGTDVPYELRQALLLRAQMEYDGWNADASGTMRGAAEAYDRIVRGAAVGMYP
jgi:uncharacterized phiE125 gp8 family phage protein